MEFKKISSRPKAILTFDVEFWYNSKFLNRYIPKDKDKLNDYSRASLRLVLDLLNKHNQEATFFVLGQLAKRYPEIIKDIFRHHHEVASHGYSHLTLLELGPKQFEEEISKTNQIIKDIIGQSPIGFRAAKFSLNKRTNWALEILNKHGFKYDSSVHPLRSYKISNKILELSSSLGGIYFRILPLNVFVFLIRHISKTQFPILYFHPYELFEFSPKISSAPWYKKKIKYWGTKGAWGKFERLMERFDFTSIQQYLHENTLH